jgi:uncharacterized membrane protein YoaT (DUF817 family)
MNFPWQDSLYRSRLKNGLKNSRFGWFVAFGLKQAWSCIFGAVMVIALIATSIFTLPLLPRYDWLFIIAVLTQIILIATKLERPKEVVTIIVFHLTGLGMELFKTSAAIGSWAYPGKAHIHLLTVPLFSGFMYAAVGSYIARSWSVFHLRFTNYPNRLATIVLALAIYVNFFTHHYIWDFRWLLFAAVFALFLKTKVYYRVLNKTRQMPMIVAFTLIALMIWLAENIATYFKVWLYPSQTDHWHLVGIQKIGSWFLLMIISFIMVELMHHKFPS